MARPHKTGLDYFPIDVYFDEDIELLEAEQGLVGFAILIKLWQKIYANGYYMDSKEDNILLFSKKINTDINLVKSVINTCLRRNIFSNNIYEKYKILTSCGIQKRFITACSQSKRKTISLITELILVNSDFIELITEQTTLNHEFSTQSKVKEKRVKEIKEKDIPTLKIFGEYAIQHKPNADKQDIKLKYEAWVENGWKDGNGKDILNWKTKILNTLPHIKENKEPVINKIPKRSL